MATSPSACLNCGAALTGGYCARCGQKAVNPDPTLKGFLHETTHELTHWDGKIPATLKTLFLRPGVLTVDLLEGRRARWLTPLRVYLICSLAFFGGRVLLDEMGLRTLREMARVTLEQEDRIPGGPLTAEQRERIAQAPLGRILGVERLERAIADSKRLNREFDAVIPRAVFILLPLFALLTNVAWRKVQPRYPAHLYLALHIHAALFGALFLFSIIAGLLRSDGAALVAWLVFVCYSIWYGLTSFRRVFREAWPNTLLKAVAVGVAYWLCVAVVALSFLAFTVLRI